MTTTAFDDQFVAGTQTIERIREHLSRESILRWNIAALEVALRTQTSRAEAAEAELAKAREQTPVGWMREDGNLYLAWQKDLCLPEVRFSPLYAAPVPTPDVPVYLLERQENGLSWYIGATTSRGSAWHWTADVNAAIRFSRKDDAIACWNIIARHHVGIGGSGTTETTPKQHIFEDARALLQSAGVRHD